MNQRARKSCYKLEEQANRKNEKKRKKREQLSIFKSADEQYQADKKHENQTIKNLAIHLDF